MSTTESNPHYSERKRIPLPRELNYVPDELQRRASSELFENENTKMHSLKLLRSMLKDESGLIWYDEDFFLLAFLRARKFDVKRAFTLVKNFYTIIGKRDELYYNFDFDDVRQVIKENSIGFLPFRDNEGCVILLMRVLKWDPDVNTAADIMRALTSGILHAIRSPATQIAGFKVIVDCQGLTLHKLTHFPPTYIFLFSEALQNVFPGRFRAVHIVNEGPLFSYAWVVLKQFLSKKLKERFHFHGENVKKLHEFFSPSILPAEYDGELPSFDNREWGAQMEGCADYLAHIFSQGYEKCRVKSQKKYATGK